MKVSVPAAAPPVPPDTGASTNAPPPPRTSSPNACALAGSMVLESITIAPAARPASTPFSCVSTARTCAAAGSIVTTNAAPAAASRGEAATCAPPSFTRRSASSLRSNACTSWPAFSRLSAIGAPMWPKPIKPIFIVVSGVDPSERLRAAVGRRALRRAPRPQLRTPVSCQAISAGESSC